MQALITGVSSTLGCALSRHLLQHGHGVVGFDLVRSDDIPSAVEFVQGDVREYSSIAGAAQGCDTGIHLAVQGGTAKAENIIEVNVSGAYGFMIAATDNGFRNAIIAGSAPVHLDSDRTAAGILPSTSTGKDHAYDLSKVLQESIFRDFHEHGVPAMGLRFGHIVLGAREQNLDEPIALRDFKYCRGGWVALEDVVTACVRALELCPDPYKFEVLSVIGAKQARARFDVAAVENRLGFKFQYDFAQYQ